MANWTSAKWLWWIGLYIGLGLVVPWIMTRIWSHQHGSKVRPNAKQLFQRGELGLVGLILAISVIWDIQTSQYSAETIAVGSIFLAIGGIMAVAVWIESHCRQSSDMPDDPQRAWRDSFSLAFFVFSMAIGVEVLLDRFAKVIYP
jgi:hypothetical protein